MSALISALSGVTLISAEAGTVHLQLETPSGNSSQPSSKHSLEVTMDPILGRVEALDLQPCDIEIDNILKVSHPQQLAFVVRHLFRPPINLSKSLYTNELDEAASQVLHCSRVQKACLHSHKARLCKYCPKREIILLNLGKLQPYIYKGYNGTSLFSPPSMDLKQYPSYTFPSKVMSIRIAGILL